MSDSYANPRCQAFACMLLLAQASTNASAQPATSSQATAYRLDNGAAAYREMHLRYQRDGHPAMLVIYRCLDGSAFARKTLIERSGPAMPDFDFVDGRTGYREGVRTVANGHEVYWQKSDADAEKSRTVDVPTSGVIDAGFDAMIRAQWPRLATDAGVSASFLLPSALRFFKVAIKRVDGKPDSGVTHLRMKLDTWYGFAAPDTDLEYRNSDRRLLRFKGIGSIRDTRGRHQAVRIEFPSGLKGRYASTAEIESAQRLPLTGRCGA